MIEIAIMIEGQYGLNWTRWKRIVPVVEELGFVGLFRSDHFTNDRPPDMDSLELWVSLTWLASHTQHIEFGPLVTPFSFRHPAFTARMATAVDDLSGGRLRLGLGAGWQEREHEHYSFDLLDIPGRFARFEEGLQIVTHLLQKNEPLTFHGKYYDFNHAVLLPRPYRPGGPPIVVGGNGEKRTLPLAARFADEWNGDFLTPDRYHHLNHRLDELLVQQGRSPSDVARTMMSGIIFAADAKMVQEKLRGRTVQAARERGLIVGTPNEIREQIEEYEKAGVQRLMLQWLDLDDMDGLELLAKTLLK
jgi:F420-dependent oxidoreductase-like protein